jgi:hypothetical protein
MLTAQIPVLLRHVPTGGARITFTDPFTGADGSSPNARWTQDSGTWQIQTNRLENRGGVFGVIHAASSTGDLTFSWDQDLSNAGSTFAMWIVRYVDPNNYVYFQLNGSDILVLHTNVAGVDTVIATDSTTRNGSGAGACSGSVSVSGNNISMTVTGGAQTPGTFGPNTVTALASTGAGVGFGMNTGKSGDWFDNAVLS